MKSKKAAAIVAAGLAAVIALGACSKANNEAEPSNSPTPSESSSPSPSQSAGPTITPSGSPATATVTEADNFATVNLKVGDRLVVSLKADNGSTGYHWVESAQISPSLLAKGEGKNTPEGRVFEYTAKAVAHGRLQFDYEPPAGGSPAESVDITVTITGGGAAPEITPSGNPATADVTESDNGATVSMKVGDHLRITLKADNGSTGYGWNQSGKIADDVLHNDSDNNGAKHVWEYTAKKAGGGTLSFGYTPPAGNGPATETFKLTVTISG